MKNEKISFMQGEMMSIEEAIKNIQENGIDLGAGDYVDIEALKVAVETMKDYQRMMYEPYEFKEGRYKKKEYDEGRNL